MKSIKDYRRWGKIPHFSDVELKAMSKEVSNHIKLNQDNKAKELAISFRKTKEKMITGIINNI